MPIPLPALGDCRLLISPVPLPGWGMGGPSQGKGLSKVRLSSWTVGGTVHLLLWMLGETHTVPLCRTHSQGGAWGSPRPMPSSGLPSPWEWGDCSQILPGPYPEGAFSVQETDPGPGESKDREGGQCMWQHADHASFHFLPIMAPGGLGCDSLHSWGHRGPEVWVLWAGL